MKICMIVVLCSGALMGGLLGYYGKCSSGTCPFTATPLRGVLYGSVVAELLIVGGICGPLRRGSSSSGKSYSEHLVLIGNEAEFDELVGRGDQPVLVDFYADYCAPCRRLAPVMAALADEYAGRAVVAKVDTVRCKKVAMEQGVRGIPTVVLYVNGEETERFVGALPIGEYRKLLETVLVDR
jgi:thioredoxin 1